ncbi:MAG: PDZ domain-containing protein [Myxococcales bacterium]|nr:PDZ domain-containing protein [Myxococcales bacterium]
MNFRARLVAARAKSSRFCSWAHCLLGGSQTRDFAGRLDAPFRARIGRVILAWAAGVPVATVAAFGVASAEQAKVAIQPTPAWPFRQAAAKPAPPQNPGGIGLVLEARPDGVYAQAMVAGGPAQKSGITAGDQIVRVDQWPAPADVKVPQVAEHIRGTPGTTVELQLKRSGRELTVSVVRVALNRLFPETSKDLLVAKAGFALLASGTAHTLGVRFVDDAKNGELLRYDWAIALPTEAAGGTGHQRGQGAVLIHNLDGASIQVADWKIELRPQADVGVIVSASNLPVFEVVGDWLAQAPPWPLVVKPRTSVAKRAARWQGPALVKVQLLADGKPLTKVRATFRLGDASAQALETTTQTSGTDGVVAIPAPNGLYRVQALVASASGAGSDVFVTHDLEPSTEPVQAGQGAKGHTDQVLVIKLKPKPAVPAAQLNWASDPRIGQGLPPIDVQRWFGLDRQPKSLARKVLLVDVWATWCGPCKMTAPLVAELHARLASKGLVTVALSVDKDETAIVEYAKDQLPGGVPIAWAGPDAMETLDTESVPTFFVIDALGRIRGVHKGMGWNLSSVEAFLETLLQEGAGLEKAK